MTTATALLASRLAEDVAEDIAKAFAESAETRTCATAGATHVRVHTGVAELVVGRALFRVRQHFISLFGFFEFHLGRGVPLVAVRVEFHRQFAVRLFDFVFAGVFGYSQNFVKIAFSGHVCAAVKSANAAPAFSGQNAAGQGLNGQGFLTSLTSASTTLSSCGLS